jgi:hypothetical protein
MTGDADGEGIDRRHEECQRLVDNLTNRGEPVTVHDAIALTQHATLSTDFARIWLPRFSKVLARWDDDSMIVWEKGRPSSSLKKANPEVSWGTWGEYWNWLDAIRIEWPRTLRVIGQNLIAMNALISALSPEAGTEWWLTTPMAIAAPMMMPGFIGIFWGAPGSGKSDIAWAVVEESERCWEELCWQREYGDQRKSILHKLTEKYCPQVLNSGKNSARLGLYWAQEFKIVTNIMPLPPEPGKNGRVDPFQQRIYNRVVYCNSMSQFQMESADVEEDTFCQQWRDESGPGFANTRSLSEQHKSIEDEIRYKRKDDCSLGMLTQDAVRDFPKYMFDDTRPGCASLIVRKKPGKQNRQPDTARVSIGALGWRGKLVTEIPATGVRFRSTQKSTFKADITFEMMLNDMAVSERNALSAGDPWGQREEHLFVTQYCARFAGMNTDQQFLRSPIRHRMVLEELRNPDQEKQRPLTRAEVARKHGVSDFVIKEIIEKDERKQELLAQARQRKEAEKIAHEQMDEPSIAMVAKA